MDHWLKRWYWIAGIVVAAVAVLGPAQYGGNPSSNTSGGIHIGDVEGDITIGTESEASAAPIEPTPMSDERSALLPTTTHEPPGVNVEVVSEPIPCDGRLWKVALVLGLRPGEDVEYIISPAPKEPVIEGEADGDGTKDVSWSCLPGVDDGGTSSLVRFVVVGKESGERVEFGVRTTAPVFDELSVEMQAADFICDGVERNLAVVSGFLTGESVAYQLLDATAASQDLIATPADERGRKQLRWICQTGSERAVVLVVHAIETQRTAEVHFSYVSSEATPVPLSFAQWVGPEADVPNSVEDLKLPPSYSIPGHHCPEWKDWLLAAGASASAYILQWEGGVDVVINEIDLHIIDQDPRPEVSRVRCTYGAGAYVSEAVSIDLSAPDQRPIISWSDSAPETEGQSLPPTALTMNSSFPSLEVFAKGRPGVWYRWKLTVRGATVDGLFELTFPSVGAFSSYSDPDSSQVRGVDFDPLACQWIPVSSFQARFETSDHVTQTEFEPCPEVTR